MKRATNSVRGRLKTSRAGPACSITASFITTPNLGVELPKAASKATSSQQRDLIFVVTRTGQIQYENQNLSTGGLLSKLRELHKKRPNARILIQADTKAYHGKVVRVMDAAKAAGFKRLGVAIQRR